MKTNCIICKKEFNVFPYKIRIGEGKFCSKKCAGAFRSNPESKWKNNKWLREYYKNYARNVLKIKPRQKKVFVGLTCAGCGGTFFVSGHNKKEKIRKFCSRACSFKYRRDNIKEGRTSCGNGYVLIKCSKHPMANNRGYIYLHRLVMEEKIGRYLTQDEVVHHIDGNKKNNSIENLMLFNSTKEHSAFHNKERWINWRQYLQKSLQEPR